MGGQESLNFGFSYPVEMETTKARPNWHRPLVFTKRNDRCVQVACDV